MSQILPNRPVNGLLAGLPHEDRTHLESLSRLEHPDVGQVLRRSSAASGEIWFPHTSVVALTTTDASGRSVQTGLVGRAGCIGAESMFRAASALPDAVVQIPGVASVIPAGRLAAAMEHRPAIRQILLNFLYCLSVQSIQTVACNQMHGLEARCCRWLLTMQDHTGSEDLFLTQENLALLLGSGRPRVNRGLGILETNGLIERRRGYVRLLTRAGLRRLACECYAITYEGPRIRPTLYPAAAPSPE